MMRVGKLGMEGRDAAFRLRILATSDLHAHLMPYDYAWDRPLARTGLLGLAPLIEAARDEAGRDACLLVDNGDSLQGSLIGDRLRLGGRGPLAGLHPMIAAMNALGYDGATLGNHDMDFGPALVERIAGGAAFPIVLSNLVRERGASPDGDRPLLPQVAMIERRLTAPDGRQATLRIGLLGLMPPQVLMWEHNVIGTQLQARPIVEAARHWVGHLRDAGADLVVALCHSGIDAAEAGRADPGRADPGRAEAENAALGVAALPGVDVVVSGHTHGIFPGPDWPSTTAIDGRTGRLAGKPAVMPGCWGSHLGQVDLTLTHGAGGWRITGQDARLIPAPAGRRRGTAPLTQLLRPAHRATIAAARKPIGATAQPLSSYLAPLGPTVALALVHEAQGDWLGAMVEGTALAHLPRLSAASALKSGGRGGPQHYTDIPAGPLERRHVADLYPFPNTLAVLRLSGARVRDWLERSAALYARIEPGLRDQPLLDPAMPAYNFDTIAGLTYRIDPTAPALFGPGGARVGDRGAGRVRNLLWRGVPVEDGQDFLVVTNNYRASGGGGFPGIGLDAIVHDSSMGVRDLLTRHIARGLASRARAPDPATDPTAPFWSLDLPPGTSALFETGPGALRHGALRQGAVMTGLALSPRGLTEAGFLRLSVTAGAVTGGSVTAGRAADAPAAGHGLPSGANAPM